jgi:hypothetical protein
MCLRILFYIRFRSGRLLFIKKVKIVHTVHSCRNGYIFGKIQGIHPAGTYTFGIPTLGLTHVSDPWLVPLHRETYNKGRKFCLSVAKADLEIHREKVMKKYFSFGLCISLYVCSFLMLDTVSFIPQSTYKVSTATFWRTFHHDGKICSAW